MKLEEGEMACADWDKRAAGCRQAQLFKVALRSNAPVLPTFDDVIPMYVLRRHYGAVQATMLLCTTYGTSRGLLL